MRVVDRRTRHFAVIAKNEDVFVLRILLERKITFLVSIQDPLDLAVLKMSEALAVFPRLDDDLVRPCPRHAVVNAAACDCGCRIPVQRRKFVRHDTQQPFTTVRWIHKDTLSACALVARAERTDRVIGRADESCLFLVTEI
jgi:hypothetical protein